MRPAEFDVLDYIEDAATWYLSEKVAVLQMSEIVTACNITQISTPQHDF